MKKLLLLFALTMFSSFCKSQNVNIPDANFKAFLVSKTYINTNGDGEIQSSEAKAYTGIIDCNTLNIKNLTGIEAFTKITDLSCYSNQLTSLDVTKNIALKFLSCDDNQIAALDLSKNTALQFLYCNTNLLATLDVTKNTALVDLWCGENNLTSLDVSKNISLSRFLCFTNKLTSVDVSKNLSLELFWCYSNQLTTLNVTKNTLLKELSFDENQVTTLDLSKNKSLVSLTCESNKLSILDTSANTLLEELYIYNNKLTSIDVSKNTKLNYLKCSSNQLANLDVSKNKLLAQLYCSDNQLTGLNLKNGKNTLLTTMDASRNTGLICIQVDNSVTAATNTRWYKDSGANYNTDCSATLSTNDSSEKNIKMSPNPTKSTVNFSEDSNVAVYNTLGQKVLTMKNTGSVNLSKFSSGVYIIVLTDKNGNEIQRTKIIKN